MKKFFVLLAVVAVAAVAIISCNKQDDPAIASIKAAMVGDWKGDLGDASVTVTFIADGKITATNNFTANITKWYMKSGAVWVNLNNDPAMDMAIDIKGVNMTLTTNSAAIKLPSSLKKMLAE